MKWSFHKTKLQSLKNTTSVEVELVWHNLKRHIWHWHLCYDLLMSSYRHPKRFKKQIFAIWKSHIEPERLQVNSISAQILRTFHILTPRGQNSLFFKVLIQNLKKWLYKILRFHSGPKRLGFNSTSAQTLRTFFIA